MKKTKLVATGLALTIALSACGSSNAQKTGLRASDGPYMTINDKKITNKDFYAQYDLFARAYALNTGVGNSVKNMMQRDYVIQKDIEENKIEIKDEEYKKAVDEAIEKMGGEEKYKDYLNFMDTTKEIFESNIKFNLNNTKHAEWYAEQNAPTDEKLNEYYEAHKKDIDTIDTKHILVKDEETANEIYGYLEEGKDFKELSDQYSEDPAVKANGGELGSKSIGKLDPAYVQGAVELEEGKYSKPVKSSFGYHIIYLNSKKVGLDANKEEITKSLTQQEHEAYIAKKISELNIKEYDIKGEEVKPQGQQGLPGQQTQPADGNK